VNVLAAGTLSPGTEAAPAPAPGDGSGSSDKDVGGGLYTPDTFSKSGDRVEAKIVRRHLLGKATATVKGRVNPARSGQIVVIEKRTGKKWRSEKRVRTNKKGEFNVSISVSSLGSTDLRVVLPSLGSTSSVKSPLGTVYSYQKEFASWYGPGFYGHKMSCGKTLKRSTVAVAHKTLPCGTKVRFHSKGKTIVVPVEDRGPFVQGRNWDLTEAAKDKLGAYNDVWVSYNR